VLYCGATECDIFGMILKENLAVLVPTKDRPFKIRNLLESICKQSFKPAHILIVNGGSPIDAVVQEFERRLSVEVQECHPAGQIRQRNQGLAALGSKYDYIACVDDDIEFEPDAFHNLMNFWNAQKVEPAGVSFNLVNNPELKVSNFMRLALFATGQQGRILKSGQSTSIAPAKSTFRSQWLCGGCTIWRKEILDQYPHRDIRSSWAICEDIIFSYPIGKKHPLYVCSEARARHEHYTDPHRKYDFRFNGRAETLWRLYFVKNNPDLSLLAFIWMTACTGIGRLGVGIFRRQKKQCNYFLGQVEGLTIGLLAFALSWDLKNLIEKKTLL